MDLFSTDVLTGVVNSLQGSSPNAITNFFFPGVQTEESQDIHFDVQADVMGLADYVLPVVEAAVQTEPGFTTKTFRPAYIKIKTPFEAASALRRVMGEPLTGAYSGPERMRMRIKQTLQAHRQLILNSIELQSVQALRTGIVTITGTKYPTATINYNRDPLLTVTLTGATRWGQTGVKPLNDLQDWADLIGQKSGSAATDVVMEIGAWKVFRIDADVIQRLNTQRTADSNPSARQAAINKTGLTYQGTIDGFNIYTYQGLYKDAAGVVQRLLPSGTVLMVGEMLGYQAYGAILDEAANFHAVPYFSKSWIEEDPSSRLVMTQSAPLMVPYRPNASLAATVL